LTKLWSKKMNCIFAKTIYAGKSVENNAYLVFQKDKIVGISKSARGKVLGKCAVITPAFIDPHSHIGICRTAEPHDEAEGNDQMETMMTLTDVLDSVQMDDTAFADAIEMGVLYSCVVPGSGNIVSGLSAVIRHYGSDTTSALIGRAGVKAALGYNPMSTTDWKGQRPTTRMGAFRILRAKLDEVRLKMQKYNRARGSKKQDITFTAEEKVLCDILKGKLCLRVHVHKIDDIAALLRLLDEFKIKVTVEHACDVHKSEMFEQLKNRRIPVTYGPVDCFAYKVELKHDNWRNIKHLIDSGVQFGLMTDHPVVLSRQLFLQTRWFLRAGLSKSQVIEIITRQNARILGIDKFLGTLEKGKWASFTCWNNDPFELSSFPATVYGEGQMLYGDKMVRKK